ncbi:TIGR03032 family protein [Microbacteriaceae bacterium K1510]|nr:TIGR03032 family protein [Microbacteriaceae bacterium K1510]
MNERSTSADDGQQALVDSASAGTDAAQPPSPTPETTPPQQQPVKISCTRGLAGWLLRNNVSIAFSSYQSGRLYLVGVDKQERISFHERFFARAMGLWADQQRILLATLFQLWRLENVLGPEQSTSEGADRHYVPRVAHTTGDLDIHDVAVMTDGRIVFVNTSYSCLAMLSPVHSFRMVWKPPFISKLAPEDRCHLNGLAMRDGMPAYVTAVCKSDVVNGWRDRRAEGGCVIDVTTDAIISDRLSMPHSPRLYDGKLWVLNSGTGYLGTVDLASGEFVPHTFCPGFLRGLAFHNGHALVGLSLPRNGSFSGLALDAELKKRDAEPWCGVQIIELASGNIVEWIRLEGDVTELFDVQVIPGVRYATATGMLTDDIQRIVTFEVES